VRKGDRLLLRRPWRKNIPTWWHRFDGRQAYEPIYNLALQTRRNPGGKSKSRSWPSAMARKPISWGCRLGTVVLIADGVTDAPDGLDATLAA
jgi:hypothetical protein